MSGMCLSFGEKFSIVATGGLQPVFTCASVYFHSAGQEGRRRFIEWEVTTRDGGLETKILRSRSRDWVKKSDLGLEATGSRSRSGICVSRLLLLVPYFSCLHHVSEEIALPSCWQNIVVLDNKDLLANLYRPEGS